MQNDPIYVFKKKKKTKKNCKHTDMNTMLMAVTQENKKVSIFLFL